LSEEQHDPTGVQAIQTLLNVLGPLTPETRANVLDFVFKALKISLPSPVAQANPTTAFTIYPDIPASLVPSPQMGTDLRTLTDQKKPTSANQMVAIVGYYLAHLAPAAERRDYIVPEDVKKYFLQGNFPLTANPGQTLVNAKNAGYLDAAGSGQYRLNPVGHNLVAHKMPRGEGDGTPRKKAKKGAKKKKARK
jgi:hypothetical protein